MLLAVSFGLQVFSLYWNTFNARVVLKILKKSHTDTNQILILTTVYGVILTPWLTIDFPEAKKNFIKSIL